MTSLNIVDLFCGAGGTSAGLYESAREHGRQVSLVAVNHWPRAIETHSLNHPTADHRCVNVDSLDVAKVAAGRQLDVLWASPACTHHSRARGGKPMDDQSRATAWCVVRWAEITRPKVILVENVKEFQDWGPLGSDGRPLASRKSELFRQWVETLRTLGYRVEWRVLCAADFGAPTTRERLFVQAVLGRRKLIWPEPTHSQAQESDMFRATKPWVAAREIIDWELKGTSIFTRKKPLAEKTLRRIFIGLERYGFSGAVVAWDNQSGSGTWSADKPLSTVVTKARHGVSTPSLIPLEPTIQSAGGPECPARPVSEPMGTVLCRDHRAIAVPFLMGQQSKAAPRPVSEPAPTVATAGAISLVSPFMVEFYGNGTAASLDNPVSTVTTHDRFGLVEPLLRHVREKPGVCPRIVVNGQPYELDILFRMLRWHELARAQSFPANYQFAGTDSERVKQIGNAVPPALAKALINAHLAAGQI